MLRWQRRWFVLYDDGELTYSVDEHPNTIPQAVIDMTKAVEVASAEELTGNQFSLAITTPDKVHFVKGTGRDDSKWWFDVLSQFPGNMVRSKNKRNVCSLPVTKAPPAVAILDTESGSKGRSRRYLKRESRGLKSQRSRSDGVAKMVPRAADLLPHEWAGENASGSGRASSPPPSPFLHNPVYLLLAEPPRRKRNGTGDSVDGDADRTAEEGTACDCSRLDPVSVELGIDGRWVPGQLLLGRWRAGAEPTLVAPVRRDGGDGGCALPHSPPCRDLAPWPPLPPEEPPKGWLLRLGPQGEWSKHWFVLRNASLAHFGDPSAEEAGAGAGLDLRRVRDVVTLDGVERSYAFAVLLRDEGQVVLRAVTAGIRTNWVQAIRRAVQNRSGEAPRAPARVPPSPPSPPVPPEETPSEEPPPAARAEATSSSDDHSEYFSIVDDEEEEEEDGVDSPSRNLPPSPPLNRTAISRVKERARSRSNSRSRQSRRLRSPMLEPSEPSCEPDETALSDRSGSWDPSTHKTEAAGPWELKDAPVTARVEVTAPSVVQDTSPVTRRPPVSRTSRRSSSLRELRTKKLESRCSELEEQLRVRDREIGNLRSAPFHLPSWALVPASARDESLLASLEALEAFLSTSVEKMAGLKDRLRKASEEDPTRATGLWRLCEELEALLRENEQKAEATARALRRAPVEALATTDSECLQGRLARAAEECWALKRELRRSQDAFDDLELRCLALERDSRGAEEMHASQLALMTARIDDLTAKLALSEKAQRQLRQRLARADSKQEKRRLSLKGKEAASPSKELEAKLAQLEHKFALLEEALQGAGNELASDDLAVVEAPVGRRASLDSLSGESQGLLLRVQLMDHRLQSALERPPPEPLSRPRICLQTEAPGAGDGLGWNSLSLAASVTDLRMPEQRDADLLPSTYQECLDSVAHRLDSLLSWLHQALLAVREANGVSSFPTSLLDRIGAPELLESAEASVACSLLLLGDATAELQTVVAENSEGFVHDLVKQLRQTSRLVSAFEERLDFVACSHDLRLVGATAEEDDGKHAGGKAPDAQFFAEDGTTSAQVLAAELDAALHHLDELTTAAERFNKSKRALVLRRLSECLDVHPTSDLEPDALENAVEQEAVLGTVTEAVSAAYATVIGRLRNALGALPFAIVPTATARRQTTLLQRLESAAEEAYLQVRADLRSSCLAELESYCSANLPHDVLDREIVPIAQDLATAACVSAVLRGYANHLCERVERTLEAIRRGDAPGISKTDEEPEVTAHELVRRAQVFTGDAPALLDTWLTRCLDQDDAERPSSATAAGSADAADTLARLGGRLREEKEGQRWRVLALQERLDAAQRDCERLLKAGCATCRGLREQARALAQRTAELERAARDGSLCERCPGQREQLRRMAEERERAAADREAACGELQCKLRRQEANHQRAVQGLESELQAARRQLQRLQRLCERGLAALEASHGRQVAQLEERHRAELERVHADRDRVLAQETQATLAALNAMQRAHQEELQREICNLKEGYAHRMKHGAADCLQREHREELEQIHGEILSLSEQFSRQCLEKASLEERLQLASQQLHEANFQVLDLLARNKQLSAQLSLQVLQREQASQDSPEELQKLLALRESQLVQQHEENAQAVHCLQLARTKISQLSSQCQQLGNSLRAERGSRQLESQRLQARLEGLVASPGTHRSRQPQSRPSPVAIARRHPPSTEEGS
ncbi:P116 Rho-interacting protein, putative [Ixodes scapularis]|uniref:p116 Rho-interacting protein, Putative n=1 Tax=Ixodes scapularis TaxID=6945 RepID=B7PVU2_IXOSC|nr:P116 Rho-interacting protein, putative [Ixodes scapularis]|eukprot:XP_002408646.1 P116 Rho-interacting protein, putative [Ixodes scapularis]